MPGEESGLLFALQPSFSIKVPGAATPMEMPRPGLALFDICEARTGAPGVRRSAAIPELPLAVNTRRKCATRVSDAQGSAPRCTVSCVQQVGIRTLRSAANSAGPANGGPREGKSDLCSSRRQLRIPHDHVGERIKPDAESRVTQQGIRNY